MGFVEIEKTSRSIKKLAVDATYKVNNKGVGTLRFTRNGMDKLNNLIGKSSNNLYKIYIDTETKSLAFKQSEEGTFKLHSLGKDRNSLSYSALSKEITEPVNYLIEKSKEYTFILIPDEGALATTKATKEEKPPVSKKGRSKKNA